MRAGVSAWGDARARGLAEQGRLLVVDVPRQRMTLFSTSGRVADYRVSTAERGVGSAEGSLMTPPGWHEVAAWIGKGTRRGTVFRSRKPTGEVLSPKRLRERGEVDLILTRILRLRGLEPGVNVGPGIDSFRRFIYIHGTNQEHRLGKPASHGCIRMSNRDVVDLFRRTLNRPTYVLIRGT